MHQLSSLVGSPWTPPHDSSFIPHTPSRRHQSRRANSIFNTPHHPHPYPYSYDSNLSLASLPPESPESISSPEKLSHGPQKSSMARARSRSRGRRVSFKPNRDSDQDDVYSSPSKPKLHSRREDAEELKSTTRPSTGKGTVRADTPDSESFKTNRGSDRDDVYSSSSKPKLRSRREDAEELKYTRPSNGKGTVRADMPDSESFETNRGSDRDDVYSSPSKPKLRSRREDAREHKSTTRLSNGKGTVRADAPDSESFKTNGGSDQDDVYFSPSKPKLRSRREVPREPKSTTRPPNRKAVRVESPDSESFKTDRGDDRDDVYSSPSKPRSRCEVVTEHKSSTTRPPKKKGKTRAQNPDLESSPENPSNCESGRDDLKSYLRGRTPGPKIGLPKGGHDSKRRPKGVLEGA